jgi:hypothetical protein
MFVKFCEAKHNLAKNCSTIGLGTMQFFADDNPDFFRFDYSEGAFKVTNDGASMHIDKGSMERLTRGGIKGAGTYLAPGSNFTIQEQFPNCYIFCFSRDIIPTIDMAKKIDDSYDDWFEIYDLPKFVRRAAELLMNQLEFSDLEATENMTMEWFRGLNLSIVHRPCTYDGRELVFSQDTIHQALQATGDPLRWAFSKEAKHSDFNEYRILFVLQDSNGSIVPVKKGIKILNLLPELGVGTLQVDRGGQ